MKNLNDAVFTLTHSIWMDFYGNEYQEWEIENGNT